MITDLVVAKLDTARSALMEAKTIQETKKILDVASAAEIYARRQHLGEESIRYATAIKVEALAQLGRMLDDTPRNEGGRPLEKTGTDSAPVSSPARSDAPVTSRQPTLAELGLDKKTSKLAQDVAKLPTEQLERVKEGVVTLHKAQQSVKDRGRKAPVMTAQFDVGIRRGDFRKVLSDIPDNSVKIILTDPPYGKAALPLWVDLGVFASRVLRDDGILVAYSGQMYLPDVINALALNLDWWWLSGLIHTGSGNLTPLGQPVRKVINQFKPLLMFVPKGGGVSVVFRDLVSGTGASKDKHNWAQPVEEAKIILETFSKNGKNVVDDGEPILVVDPFAGSGSVGQAAKDLGLRFAGAEILDNGRDDEATEG